MNKRRAYIAKYPLSPKGDRLDEVILFSDEYWTPRLSELWMKLTDDRKPSDPMLQGWYSDKNSVVCIRTTNQPFKLS